MQFEINNISGAVLFTADLDCDESTTHAVQLGLAVRVAVAAGADLTRANLSGADLTRANLSGADLSGADLTRANLTRANLTRANLTRANLTRANLTRANLTRANLYGANLREAKIRKLLASVDRSDGYQFLLFSFEDREPTIAAGCRFFTVAEFRTHVANEYPGTSKARETLRILDYFDATIAQERDH